MVIVVDKFEPKDLQVVGHVVEPIWVDFIIQGEQGKIAIERKSVNDLASSISTNRIWEQLERLKQLRDTDDYKVMVVFHGNVYKIFRTNRLPIGRYIGFLSYCIMNDIPVFFVPDKRSFVMLLSSLNKRVEGEHRSSFKKPSRIKKTGRSIDKEVLDVLTTFYGIGEKKARQLLEHYGSLQAVFEADDINDILNDKTAKHFRRVLEYEWDD